VDPLSSVAASPASDVLDSRMKLLSLASARPSSTSSTASPTLADDDGMRHYCIPGDASFVCVVAVASDTGIRSPRSLTSRRLGEAAVPPALYVKDAAMVVGVAIELELPSARVDGELRFKVGGARGASPADVSSTTESTRPRRRATTASRYKASMRWGSSRSGRRRVLLTPEMDGGGVLEQAWWPRAFL